MTFKNISGTLIFYLNHVNLGHAQLPGTSSRPAWNTLGIDGINTHNDDDNPHMHMDGQPQDIILDMGRSSILTTGGLKSYIIPRHKLGYSFCGHKYLKS